MLSFIVMSVVMYRLKMHKNIPMPDCCVKSSKNISK